jgi:hypothetical protein
MCSSCVSFWSCEFLPRTFFRTSKLCTDCQQRRSCGTETETDSDLHLACSLTLSSTEHYQPYTAMHYSKGSQQIDDLYMLYFYQVTCHRKLVAHPHSPTRPLTHSPTHPLAQLVLDDNRLFFFWFALTRSAHRNKNLTSLFTPSFTDVSS